MNRVVEAQSNEATPKFLIGIFFALGLFTAAMAGAQGTTAFTFQGALDVGGSPANGAFDFQFILFDGPDPFIANQKGPVVNEVNISVEDGLFFVFLDFGPGIFNGDMLWLQILVRETGVITAPTPLFPLHKLTPVPYCTFAINSNELDGLDSTDFVQTEVDPSVGAAVKVGCSICIGHADQNGPIPERQQCFSLNDTGGLDFGNFLQFSGGVDSNDRLWLWIDCP